MATFLDVEQLVDLFLGELPDGVFADDRADNPNEAKRSYSSSEIRAMMSTLADAYANLEVIYNNKFATTLAPAETAALARWEKDWFPNAQDAAQSFSTRQNNLLKKLREEGGISFRIISALLDDFFAGSGLTYDLVTYCGMNGGAWVLDESELDSETYLADTDPLLGAMPPNPLDCALNYIAAGLTLEQFHGIQATAYTYEVRIHGTASGDFLSKLDTLLTEREPARSTHVIYNNFPGPVAP